MSINDAIVQLQNYTGPAELTLHKGARELQITAVENAYGITLPDDFKKLYRFSDGFETVEDIFNMIPLAEIIDNKKRHSRDPFYIAEYMIYSDMWNLEVNPDDSNDCKITYFSYSNKLVLTHSLAEFIERFLRGHVFDEGGLYEWHDEVESQSLYSTDPQSVKLLLTVYYYGLIYGIASKEEIVAWADQIILSEDNPNHFFIEISLSRDLNELITVINTMRISENSASVRAIFGLLYHKLTNNEITAEKAISVIDKCNLTELLTSSEIGNCYELTDELWMGEVTVSNDELTKWTIEFLSNYKDFNLKNHREWAGIDARMEYKLKEDDNKLDSAYETKITKQKIKDKMLLRGAYAIFYLLALISIITLAITYDKVQNKTPLNKFQADLYQFSSLYFSLFTFYYLLKTGDLIVRKVLHLLKKMKAS